MALCNSSTLKSGQRVSQKYNSLYATCHNKKLLILISPPVLINKSIFVFSLLYKYAAE